MSEIKKPLVLRECHLLYLDELRESGDTNMFGARPYLVDEFSDLTPEEAGQVLSYWMKTFGERRKANERTKKD